MNISRPLLPLASQRRIVVLESVPFWAPELRRELEADAVDVSGCDRVQRLDDLLTDEETLLVWAADRDAEGLLTWLGHRLRRNRVPRLIVCGSPDCADLEWTLRGLGAISWSNADPAVHELAALCRRCFSTATR